MKTKLLRYADLLSESLRSTALRHPVELALITISALLTLLGVELNWGEEIIVRIWMLPVFALVALVVGTLAGRTAWRKVYFVSWAPLIPLLRWPHLKDWITTMPFAMTMAVLLPLALLMCRRSVRNRRFVCDTLIFVRSAVLAVLFANIALGLFQAILWSAAYIFGFADAVWVGHLATDILILAEMLLLPALFLMMLDRWSGCVCRSSRALEVLLNYIVTPSLMIYAAILYLYMAKIIMLWTLPEGGVAYMVFAFALLTLLVRALQSLSEKRFGEWFYRAYSFVMLPIAVLFWAGVARRVGEYGLTEPRVYLIACGSVMSLAILLFLTRHTGRYLYLCLAAFVCFALLAYVPALHPERIAIRSQVARAKRIAASLGRLGADGRLLSTPVPLADTTRREEYRKLCQSLDYLQYNVVDFGSLGMDYNEFVALLPEQMGEYVRYGLNRMPEFEENTERYVSLEMPYNATFDNLPVYTHYHTNLYYWAEQGYEYRNDTLRILLGKKRPVLEITGTELLEIQLEQSGFDPLENTEPTTRQLLRALDYRGERCRVLFEQLRIGCSDSTVVLRNVSVKSVWTR